MNLNLKIVIGIALNLIGIVSVFGQVEYPSLSPEGRLIQMVGNTSVEIEYERPSARNRRVYGALVPYNKVWRTGAGYCTKISFDKPVILGGQPIKAGQYSILTIPNPNEWIVILNSDTTLYGSSNYNSKKDVARFIVIPSTTHLYYETLTFDIDLIPNNAKIYVSWENTQIEFELLTSTDDEFMRYIDESLLTKKEKDGKRYSNAAEQLYFLNARLSEALILTDIAIEMDSGDGFARRVKMDIYEKMHLYQEAMEAVNQAIEYEKIDTEIPHWENHKERIAGKMKNTPDQG